MIKLYIDTLDDLWVIHTVVAPGDRITCLTERREERRDDLKRSSRGEKIKMRLTLEVEELNFHEFQDWLRVQGIIREGPQGLGQHHTFNLEPGQDITVWKAAWESYHLRELKEAVERTKQPNTIIVAIEDDNATVAVLHQYGIQTVASIDRGGLGKQYENQTDTKEWYFEEVVISLRAVAAQSRSDTPPPLLIIGPGFTKESLRKHLAERAPAFVEHCAVESTAHAGLTGIHEALKLGLVGKAVAETRVEKETQLVEKLLAGIGKSGLVTYGQREIEHALMIGAVEELLVIDTMVRDGRARELFEAADAIAAEVHVISTVHEAGEKLDAIGGLGAFLRFRIE